MSRPVTDLYQSCLVASHCSSFEKFKRKKTSSLNMINSFGLVVRKKRVTHLIESFHYCSFEIFRSATTVSRSVRINH